MLPETPAAATCQRRSPVESEGRATPVIPSTAAKNGMAAKTPTAKLLASDLLRISVGSHNVIPDVQVLAPNTTNASNQIGPLVNGAKEPLKAVRRVRTSSDSSVVTSQFFSMAVSHVAWSGRSER